MTEKLLIPPSVSELSKAEISLINDVLAKNTEYDFLITGGFSVEVNPSLLGFYIDRVNRVAVPAYQTNNGIFAVTKDPETGEITDVRVDVNSVYRTNDL